MAGTAGDHQQMPDGVIERNAFVAGQKIGARGVTETAGQHPSQGLPGNLGHHLGHRQNRQPAEQDVKRHAHVLMAGNQQLESRARQGQGPHGAQQGPAPAVGIESHAPGRVGAGDQTKDAHLIDRAKEMSQARIAKAVRKGRGAVDSHERRDVDNAAGHAQQLIVATGQCRHHPIEGQQRQDQPQPMGEQIQNFAGRVRLRRRRRLGHRNGKSGFGEVDECRLSCECVRSIRADSWPDASGISRPRGP